MKLQNLIGNKYGILTVERRLPNKGKATVYECSCECGNTHTAYASHLKRGNTKSCGCQMISSGSNHVQWTGCGEISGWFWNTVRRNGDPTYGKTRKSRIGLEFSITIDDAWELFLKQDRKCALTSLVITFPKTGGQRSTGTASLDRIDSKRGYTLDNVQWVHKDVNKMKNAFDEEYFLTICRLITEHQSTKVQ